MPPSAARDSIGRFVDALIWNWLIGGTDAHAKNYSLLLARDQVRLAPLYDVASALPYATSDRELRLAMKIGGRHDLHARRNPWPRIGSELALDGEALTARAVELAEVAPKAFEAACAAEEVVTLESDLPRRLLDLVTERTADWLEVLRRPAA